MRNLVVPTVNLNGNSAGALVGMLRNVMRCIADTQHAMAEASDVVHGRNFQLAKHPEEERYKAQQAWSERYAMLEKMHADMLQLAINIQNQDPRRK